MKDAIEALVACADADPLPQHLWNVGLSYGAGPKHYSHLRVGALLSKLHKNDEALSWMREALKLNASDATYIQARITAFGFNLDR